jgi:hypothetical protein
MTRRNQTPEQIDRMLQEADRMFGEGQPMVRICMDFEVSEQRRITGGATCTAG